jgi:hypothetical protein
MAGFDDHTMDASRRTARSRMIPRERDTSEPGAWKWDPRLPFLARSRPEDLRELADRLERIRERGLLD